MERAIAGKMAASKTKVSVHSKLTAVSSDPVVPGKTHQFTPLDHAMGGHSLHLIFYYDQSPFGFFDTDPLRDSLSRTLSLYPPFTGRLTRSEAGDWQVKCNDAGVRVYRAKVGVRMEDWFRSGAGSDERDLVAFEDIPENPLTWSHYRIQVSEFEEGGVAIGLSCPHLLADPTSLAIFFKAWTEVHRQLHMMDPPIYSPQIAARAIPNTRTESASYYATKPAADAPSSSTKMATATFIFSDSVIKQCISEIHDQCPDATPFDVLTALFWMRLARLKGPDKGDGHSLSICVDFRAMLQKPLPRGYFGNALHFSLLLMDAKHMVGSKLGDIAHLVHRHVSGVEEEEVHSVVDWLESYKGREGKYAELTMYGPELSCVRMEHMIMEGGSLMYDACFKDNVTPVHVSCHVQNVEGQGLIVVMPSPEGGFARIVTVVLPEEETGRLLEDQAILRLHSKTLFCSEL